MLPCTSHALKMLSQVENVVMCHESNSELLMPKLVDFEFASHGTQPSPMSGNMVVGTRAYFSPEKWFENPGYDLQVSRHLLPNSMEHDRVQICGAAGCRHVGFGCYTVETYTTHGCFWPTPKWYW